MDPNGPTNTSHFCHACQRTFVDANALRMHRRSSKAHATGRPVSPTKPIPGTKLMPIKSIVTSTSITGETSTFTNPTDPNGPNTDPSLKPQCRLCNRAFKDENALSDHERSQSHKNKYRASHAVLIARPRSKKPESTKETVQKKPRSRGKKKSSRSTVVSGAEAVDKREKPTSTSMATSSSTATVSLPTTMRAPSAQPGDGERKGELALHTIVPPQSRVSLPVPVPLSNPVSLVQHNWKETWSGSWTFIPLAERVSLLRLLETKCHSEKSLAKEHYWTRVPTQAEIEMTRKCNNCGVTKGQPDATGSSSASSTCRFHPAKKSFQKGEPQGRGNGARKARCINCQQYGKSNGCIELLTHDFKEADIKFAQSSPSPAKNANARQAVVLDCEIVGVVGPNNSEVSEVVRLAAVDFLSGEVLVNTFVEPAANQRVINWRTRVSGVSKSLLSEMKKQRQTVQGWEAARDLLWMFVDKQTILIGHSLHNGLAVLGMVHQRIVDSAILTRDAVAGAKEDCTRFWGLRRLAKTFIGLEIQTGKDGHDCLEDTFAAREVVLWCLGNPEKLRDWAAGEREVMALKKGRK
ncbi:putative RNA exonuclease [Aspergillus foveolatus]|uniref:putative RNA exonuclease n=1 Tax=Aspergillus foveolatus TaxID=210207 RepID=UPI003CCD51F4